MNKQQANYQLKAIVDKFAQDYEATCTASLQAFVASSKGGDRLPAPGHIYGKEFGEQFSGRCQKYCEDAIAIIEEQAQAVRDKLADAPSDEAVRTIQLLALREDLTVDEINNLLHKYGSNAQAYKAIVSVAASKGVRGLWTNPLDAALEDLSALASVFRRTFSLQSAEGGHAGGGYLSMLKLQIDSALPA